MKITKRQKQIRNEVIYSAWEEYKGEITLQELVDSLKELSLINAYRIIKKLKKIDENENIRIPSSAVNR